MSDFKPQLYFDGTNEELYALSAILVSAVKKMLAQKGDIHLSKDPEVREKETIQFAHRMRVDGLEKFNGRTLVAALNFYVDKERMAQEKALGALIVYIPEDYIARLMWLLDYGRIDEDNEAEVLDACGTVTNLIAGYFVKELCGHGYIHLEMGHFTTFINAPLNGIDFHSQEKVKHEMAFFFREEKRMVLELTMGPLKRY
ncbi:MAG: hypothetical protein HQL20_04870 [Candidatus Omnitrophica bacterium]|nr:hypothetical protein [Candidatus Omnitrophota bacterium]